MLINKATRPRYFHVARGGRRHAGEVIPLYDGIQRTDAADNIPVLYHVIHDLFPNGISEHGVRHTLLPLSEQPSQSVAISTVIEGVIEMIWEYVRRAEFRHRPSRLQSLFAWESQADAEFFLKYVVDAEVFQVHTDAPGPHFRADMKHLTIDPNMPLTAIANARAYWRGEPSTNPYWLAIHHPAPLWETLLPPPVRVTKLAKSVPTTPSQ